jgi:hypothetical protein
MSVLIKGMEMPTSCFYCPFREKVNPDDYACMALNKEFEETLSLIAEQRHKDCPLVPVPPHGRLVDADKLESGLRLMAKYQHGERQQGILGCCETICLAPTIIPAEEGE